MKKPFSSIFLLSALLLLLVPASVFASAGTGVHDGDNLPLGMPRQYDPEEEDPNAIGGGDPSNPGGGPMSHDPNDYGGVFVFEDGMGGVVAFDGCYTHSAIGSCFNHIRGVASLELGLPPMERSVYANWEAFYAAYDGQQLAYDAISYAQESPRYVVFFTDAPVFVVFCSVVDEDKPADTMYCKDLPLHSR